MPVHLILSAQFTFISTPSYHCSSDVSILLCFMLRAVKPLTNGHPDNKYKKQKDSKNHQLNFHVLQPSLPTNFHPLFLELLSLNYIHTTQVDYACQEGKAAQDCYFEFFIRDDIYLTMKIRSFVLEFTQLFSTVQCLKIPQEAEMKKLIGTQLKPTIKGMVKCSRNSTNMYKYGNISNFFVLLFT